MEQQPFLAKHLGTIKISRGRVGRHTYPTLRLPESLGDMIGKRVGVYAVGDQVIITPDEYKNKDKNSEALDSEKGLDPCLYTAKAADSNSAEPIVFCFLKAIAFV